METVQIKFLEPKPGKNFVRMVNKLVCINPTEDLSERERNLRSDKLNASSTNPLVDTNYEQTKVDQTPSNLVVVDIKKLTKNPAAFRLELGNTGTDRQPFLLLNAGNKFFNHIVLKYDGTEDSINSIKLFSTLFPEKAKQAKDSSLISPIAFRRHQVLLEKKFVKKISPLYGEMGFIKLPLNSIKDFIEFAVKEKADLLILPQTDLNHLIKFIGSDHYKQWLNHPLSFFTAVSQSQAI